ncbi:MAG TPA: zinc-binding dehydrogenase, partial [Burkholderiaceae bacterium]
MRAIVRKAYGGPEQLEIREVPTPTPAPGQVLVRVKAFGLNRAEQYFRTGAWGEVAAISGIECVGEVEHDPEGRLDRGQRVIALMGGMGRSIAGSYAEFACVPAASVVPVRSALPWERLAALPESYATAWSCLHDNLRIAPGERLAVRGANSALGQAALALARQHGVATIATVRELARADVARALGAGEVLAEDGALAARLPGLDAVLDLVGTSTVLDSLRAARRGGRVCLAGFLGGGAPLERFDPIAHLPSGRALSFFGSAFVYGTPEYP